MKKNFEKSEAYARRAGERGAALVTTLLISMLLLAAGGTLIYTTAMSGATSGDNTTEMQAYYAAEAGMQSAISVVRGNVPSSPAGTAATFRNIADNASLSKWLPTNDTVNGTAVARINVAGGTFGAYRVNVIDPDATPVGTQPSRLLIRVTGYGPRGAVKEMESVIKRGAFSFTPPSTLTMAGNVTGFNVGSSGAKGYSGVDQGTGGSTTVPMFGFTQTGSQTTVNNTTFNPACSSSYCNKATSGTSTPATATITNSNLPPWLQSASGARAFLNDLQAQASADSRYYAVKDGASGPSSLGTSASPKFSFVDGDYSAGGTGAGLLVVTGDLTFNGNFDFDGIVLVLGSWKDSSGTLHGGSLQRNGGGNGAIAGAMVVANFDRTTNGDFLDTSFNTNGGGNSDIVYDSVKAASALTTLGTRVLSVREF